MTDRESTVRDHLGQSHADSLRSVSECADAVADCWEGPATTDRDRVVGPMRRALESAGTLSRFPQLLASTAGALGEDLSASPVAAPPYVLVTSVGPVLRATLSRDRLVVTLRVFDVQRGATTRYRRRPVPPAETVDVAFR